VKLRWCILAIFFVPFSSLYSWETAIAGVLTTPPAQGTDNRIYSTADDRALHCLDERSGKEYWIFRTGRRLTDFTVVSPDHSILILTVQNVLISVSPGGHELWRFPLNNSPLIPPALDPYGSIYILNKTNTLESIDRNGHLTWKYKSDLQINNLFALYDKILLVGKERTEILHLNGTFAGYIDRVPKHILFLNPILYWESVDGSFFTLNTKTMNLEPTENPLPHGIQFPESSILITYQNKIISGRKDWFMQAMEEGEKSFHPFYQLGNNPGRTRGIIALPGASIRNARFSEKSGAPLLPLLKIDPQYLEQILDHFEKADNLQSLLEIDPDYDLLFQQILSDSQVLSFDVNRPRLDEYSRYRIYKILSHWGNLNSRETLLFLSNAERSPQNLILIMDGLGKIGLDEDHRSMNALLRMTNRNPENDSLISSAVRNASLLAKYNGGLSILEMMNFYKTLQQKDISKSTVKLIQKELNSF